MEDSATVLSKVISVQEMMSFIQSEMAYNEISMVVTVFDLYSLCTLLSIKIASLYNSFFPRKENDTKFFITSEYSLRWLGIVQIFRQILVYFYTGT